MSEWATDDGRVDVAGVMNRIREKIRGRRDHCPQVRARQPLHGPCFVIQPGAPRARQEATEYLAPAEHMAAQQGEGIAVLAGRQRPELRRIGGQAEGGLLRNGFFRRSF